MKRIFMGLCIAVAACNTASRAQSPARRVTAFAFYNLENFFDPEDDPHTHDEDFTPEGSHHYTEDIFQQKAKNMASVLAQLGGDLVPDGPAVIGVCEIENDKVLKTLLAQPQLAHRNYRFIRFQGPDRRGINVGLLYKPNVFRLLSAWPVPINLKLAGGGITRDILAAEGLLQGDTVLVLVNHWPSRSGGEAASEPKREEAAMVCRRVVNEYSAKHPEARIIVMGDLNDDPVSPSVAKVLNTTDDPEKAVGSTLYNPWHYFYNRGLGTLCHNNKWNLFDQIILSGNWLHAAKGRWQFHRAYVFDKDFLKTTFGRYKGYPHRSFNGNIWINGYSDHFPTVIYVTKETKN